MRFANLLGFLGLAIGAGLGVALGASPVAVADSDPVDAAWPYGEVGGLSLAVLPGYGGPVTTLPDGTVDTIVLHHPVSNPDSQPIPAGDEWYTTQETTSTSILGSSNHSVVTALLDRSASFPHVGTVADYSDLFLVPAVGGVVGAPLIQNFYLDDPKLGFADTFILFNVLDNNYLSDSAGVKDVVSVFGLPLTLFEFPATAADAAAPDLSDGTQQLLTELTNALPGTDTLF
jgi:hypothetical protein